MSSVGAEIRYLNASLPEGVRLVAVSKFHPVEAIREAYDAGQRLFGESRVQELLEKIPRLPSDIRWHFIGHLQTNKVRQLVGRTALIESVDSERLLDLIDRESAKAGLVTDVLLQVHVAREETKFGFLPDELSELCRSGRLETFKSVRIRGVMGMASNTDDEDRIREDFARIAGIFKEIKENFGHSLENFDIISMGMSGDWQIAIEEGSNMIRIGSMIFGERNY